MNVITAFRPRIITTGQVTAVRKYKGRIYVQFITPMRVQVSALIDYTDREFTRLKSTKDSGETVKVKY